MMIRANLLVFGLAMVAAWLMLMISIGRVSALPIQNPSNGHFYEFISDPQIDWNVARDAAAASAFLGQPGFLATVTSQSEQDFLSNNFGNPGPNERHDVWLGASDAAVEGVWRWITGPEGLADGGQGLVFPYSKWLAGEPNNLVGPGGTEDYLGWNHFQGGVPHAGDPWNDHTILDNQVTGYFIEYVPEPSTIVFAGFGFLGLLTCAWRRRRVA